MNIFFRMTLVTSLAALVAAPHAAWSQSSDWAETLGARMRIHVEQPSDGQMWRAVLDVQMEEGWNSYWLDPGYNGIPPQITVYDSSGATITSETIYQAPHRYGEGDKSYAGYKKRFALGIVPKTEADMPDNIEVFLGLCSDICVPFQARFDLGKSVSESQKKLSAFYVNNAFEAMPKDIGILDARSEQNSVTLTFPVPTGQDYELFLSTLDGWRFDDIKQSQGSGEAVNFTADIAKSGDDRATIAFSLVSADRSLQYSGHLQISSE